MKITKSNLKRIVKEELQQVFVESSKSDPNLPYIEKYAAWVLEDHFGGELEYVEVYEPEDIIPKIGDWINSHLNSLFIEIQILPKRKLKKLYLMRCQKLIQKQKKRLIIMTTK